MKMRSRRGMMGVPRANEAELFWLIRLAALQHGHMDFSYAGEPNPANMLVCIIHMASSLI